MAELADRAPVLIISHEIVGPRMTGPGIRYFHLARVLAREFPVALAVPSGSALGSDDFSVLSYQSAADPALLDCIRQARAVLVPAVWVSALPALKQSSTPLVVDGYDPFLAETLSLNGDVEAQQIALTEAYLAGDFFLCASERQRDWWLGVLEASGRVNVHTYREDPSLRHLIDLVPFGLPETPPKSTRPAVKGVWAGISTQDRVLLWGGGLWPWLDPGTAIRAVAKVWRTRQDVRLLFPGTQHPNPGMAGVATHNAAARALASELGLLDRAVFFGDWVPYADWPNVLFESDVALTLHQADDLESRLAFRSRVFDYIWAGLPTIATRGDVTSELIASYGLGVVVEPGDSDAVAAAILQLLELSRQDREGNFARARAELTWERAARPLIEFCRHPCQAPDRMALGERVGNPYYVNELNRLRDRVQAFERRRIIRWLDYLRPLRYLHQA